jgi:hypothetical protein
MPKKSGLEILENINQKSRINRLNFERIWGMNAAA